MVILVLNAGSSSLKFALYDPTAQNEITSGVIEEPDYGTAVGKVLKELSQPSEIAVVGHRVVHGGVRFRSSVRIDASVKKELNDLVELAPLHNPPALAVIEAAEKVLPNVPHVAVFDTAYYADLPSSQYIYPGPYEWYEQWGIRRFGFHGISYAYCAPRAAELLKKDLKDLNIVACHLGNGCSTTAIRGGKAISTTMGFTPLEGLMMGTRSGSVDPGILLYLQERKGLTVQQLEKSLNHQSGLMGISGLSGDFREVSHAADQGNPRARLALEIYVDRIRSAIGSLGVTLGRIDALLFTGGVGENAVALRSEVCKGLKCFGLSLDTQKNAANKPDSEIASKDSQVRVLIIHTRENFVIANEVRKVTLS